MPITVGSCSKGTRFKSPENSGPFVTIAISCILKQHGRSFELRRLLLQESIMPVEALRKGWRLTLP